MRLSSLMHGFSITVSLIGFAALLGAWFVGDTGTFVGLSQGHLYADAIVIMLIAIYGEICALYRRYLEREAQR